VKKGEIWESKGEHERVCINDIEYVSDFLIDDGYFVSYTYLEKPKDHEQPTVEQMISRQWFAANFSKCQNA